MGGLDAIVSLVELEKSRSCVKGYESLEFLGIDIDCDKNLKNT